MKKVLLLSAALTAAAAMSAQSTAPVAEWGEILHSNTAGDQASGISLGSNGEVYWLTTAGSTMASPEILLGDKVLFEGEPYSSGNSFTNNLCLLATDAAGNDLWTIHSTAGDFASGQGSVVTDGDGNVIFTAKVRHGDNLSAPICIIDAAGVAYTMGGSVESRSYNLLVAKADPDGNILWHKYITLSTVPGANATKDFIVDAVKTSGLAVDYDGNIYVGGNFSADMTVDDTVLSPANVSSWSGDSQSASGSMYILKFDADGTYVASAIGSEGPTQSQITNLEWADNYLYVLGNATGAKSFEFAGCTLEATDYQSPIVGRIDASLKADWIKCLPGEDVSGTCTIQSAGLTIVNDAVWVCGMFNGKFSDAKGSDKSISSVGKTPREGCIIKLGTDNGEWLAATTSRAATFDPAIANTGLQGYLKVIQNPSKSDVCYAYGYVMNANVGIFLREYDALTLEANTENAWSLATQGGTPSCTCIAYDDKANTAYITGRGNKAFTLAADPAIETLNPGSWSVLIAKYQLPANATTSIADPASRSGNVEYFNLQGMKVDSRNLVPGIYVTKIGANTAKIVIR